MITFGDVTIDREARTITRGGRSICYTGHNPMGRRNASFDLACILLLSRPLMKREIFDRLYGADPEGGPLSGDNVISVMLNGLAKKFGALGIRVYADKIGGQLHYWARPCRSLSMSGSSSGTLISATEEATAAATDPPGPDPTERAPRAATERGLRAPRAATAQPLATLEPRERAERRVLTRAEPRAEPQEEAAARVAEAVRLARAGAERLEVAAARLERATTPRRRQQPEG